MVIHYKDIQNFPKIGILSLKIYHLATLLHFHLELKVCLRMKIELEQLFSPSSVRARSLDKQHQTQTKICDALSAKYKRLV
jgi:hypothetical protein